MGHTQARLGKNHSLLLLAGVVMLMLSAMLGVTLARYQLSNDAKVELMAASKPRAAHLVTEDGMELDGSKWTLVGDTYTLPFWLSNWSAASICAEEDQNVTLRAIVTTASSAEETLVVLTVGTADKYIGTPEPIIEGTVAYKQYGPGTIYRFYNEIGEEVVWTLIGSQKSEISMSLAVSGGTPYTAFTLLPVNVAETAPSGSQYTYLETGSVWRGSIVPNDVKMGSKAFLAADEEDMFQFGTADGKDIFPIQNGDMVLLGPVDGTISLPLFGIPEDEDFQVEVSDSSWVQAKITENNTLVIQSNLKEEITVRVPVEKEPADQTGKDVENTGAGDVADSGTDDKDSTDSAEKQPEETGTVDGTETGGSTNDQGTTDGREMQPEEAGTTDGTEISGSTDDQGTTDGQEVQPEKTGMTDGTETGGSTDDQGTTDGREMQPEEMGTTDGTEISGSTDDQGITDGQGTQPEETDTVNGMETDGNTNEQEAQQGGNTEETGDTEMGDDADRDDLTGDAETRPGEDTGESPGNENDLPDGNDQTETEEKEFEEKIETIYRTAPITITVAWGQNTMVSFVVEPKYSEEPSGLVYLDEKLYTYHPLIPIALYTIGDDVTLQRNGEKFPAGTRYIIKEQRYILARENELRLPENIAALLDLSLAFAESGAPSVLQFTDGYRSRELKYCTLPIVAVDENPIVTGDMPLMIPMRYWWGSVIPEIKIEQLTTTDAGLIWTENTLISCSGDPDTGYIQMTPRGALSGTYKVSMVWKDALTEYYRIEFPFYVFYENGLAPRTSELYQCVRLTE